MINRDSEQGATIANRLLAALPPKDYERLSPHLEDVTLEFNTLLFDYGDPIRHVYFPCSGIISLLSGVGEVSTLEVGIVGREGMACLSLFFGSRRSRARALVQGKGTAMRIKASEFENECLRGGALPGIMLRFANYMLVQVSQTAVCYRFHKIEGRLARWLLLTGDRMETNEFPVTQDFMSNMLGASREAVSKSAGLLQKKELIGYSRGRIMIIDRLGLESVACKCYGILSAEEKRLPSVN